MSQATLIRGRLAEHSIWRRALAYPALAGHLIQPAIVSARVEDRERVSDAPWLERLSLTELVRDARAASSAGIAGLLLFGSADRKDEAAMLASERDQVAFVAAGSVQQQQRPLRAAWNEFVNEIGHADTLRTESRAKRSCRPRV